jgi:hypothetical protein
MRFGMAEVATVSCATPPDGLCVRALNPSPPRIFGCELGGVLPLPCGLDGPVLGLWPDGELARRMFSPGACLADRTRTTDRAIETDAHYRIAGDISAGRPSDAGLPLRTARLVRLLIDQEGTQVIPFPRLMLVAIGPKGRAHHINLMRSLGGDQELGIDIAAVK